MLVVKLIVASLRGGFSSSTLMHFRQGCLFTKLRVHVCVGCAPDKRGAAKKSRPKDCTGVIS